MAELISGSEAPIALLASLLAELNFRDSPAAARLKLRIEDDLRRRGRPDGLAGPSGDADSRKRSEQARDHESLRARCAALETELRKALERKALLESEVGRLRSQSQQPAGSPHGKVYLTSNAPEWLILDVRKSFRTRYHPDKHAGAERKIRAERAFQDAEQVFAQILS